MFDLDNDCPSDAFTSVIRSKADCPSWESLNTLSTSEIVLNKLVEIFEELREQGGRRKKKFKQSEQTEDKNKFNFINQSCDFGTSASVSGSVRTDLAGSIRSSTRSPDLISNDLTSIYENDLNVEMIRKQGAIRAKVENELDIYDDLEDDYVLPHQRKESKARSGSPSARSSPTRSSRYSSRNDDERRTDRYHSSRPERRRSSSRDRYRSSSSSGDERERYGHKESYRDDYRDEYRRKEDRRRQERTPEDRHRYSNSRRKY